MQTGVIGLGDMGSGLSKNLMANGFACWGLDLDPARQQRFADMGGQAASNVAEVGANADAVFVMVMNGDQAKSVILGSEGLQGHMAPGGAILGQNGKSRGSHACDLAASAKAVGG